MQLLSLNSVFIGLAILLPLLAVGIWLFRRLRLTRQQQSMGGDELYDDMELEYFEEPAYARRRKRGGRQPPGFSEPPLVEDRMLDGEEEVVLLAPGTHVEETATDPLPEKTEAESGLQPAARESADPSVAASAPREAEQSAPARQEMIVVFFLKAPGREGFRGPEILSAMEQSGLRHGKMSIFHHYGLEAKSRRQAAHANPEGVFSVANMLEPGTFNPEDMEHFRSPGLALFMRLPGPLSGRVAFELMLNSAYRLAELLQGGLEDDHHQPLNGEKIAALRAQIEDFEHQRRALA